MPIDRQESGEHSSQTTPVGVKPIVAVPDGWIHHELPAQIPKSVVNAKDMLEHQLKGMSHAGQWKNRVLFDTKAVGLRRLTMIRRNPVRLNRLGFLPKTSREVQRTEPSRVEKSNPCLV